MAERVDGIGGVFFRSPDPEALRGWYSQHLGIDMEDFGTVFTAKEGGQTVWAPFKQDTDYFGAPDQPLMVNFRVSDLDAMLAQLRGAGIQVLDHVEEHEYGRFAWAVDPEGRRFELWEPPA